MNDHTQLVAQLLREVAAARAAIAASYLRLWRPEGHSPSDLADTGGRGEAPYDTGVRAPNEKRSSPDVEP